jgi:two-component system KDP operon response regulator KdpE
MNNKRILVIEDDKDFARLLSMQLAANGYDVAVAGDVHLAVSEAAYRTPDLILLDIGLPVVNGFAVIEKLKSKPALNQVPFIVMSGRDRGITRDQATKAGASAYFSKPAANTDLLLAIRKALGW